MISSIPKNERALIKSALRKVFARSELHVQVIKEATVIHYDPRRPKVKNWVQCAVCKIPEARSYVVVDHIVPVIPADMSWDELLLTEGLDKAVMRIWCDKSNLQAICPKCHKIKTQLERNAKKEAKLLKK